MKTMKTNPIAKSGKPIKMVTSVASGTTAERPPLHRLAGMKPQPLHFSNFLSNDRSFIRVFLFFLHLLRFSLSLTHCFLFRFFLPFIRMLQKLKSFPLKRPFAYVHWPWQSSSAATKRNTSTKFRSIIVFLIPISFVNYENELLLCATISLQ